jgi:hypothetical protein
MMRTPQRCAAGLPPPVAVGATGALAAPGRHERDRFRRRVEGRDARVA